jgi:hypothetical protein
MPLVVDQADISEVLELGLYILAPRPEQGVASLDDIQRFVVHVVRLRLLGHLHEATAERLMMRVLEKATEQRLGLESVTRSDHKLRPRPTAKDTPHEAPGQ